MINPIGRALRCLTTCRMPLLPPQFLSYTIFIYKQYLPDLNRSDSPSRLSYPTPHLRVSDKQCSIKAIRLSRSRIDQRLTMTDNLSVSITSSLFNSLLLPPTLSRIRSPYMLSWSHKAPSHSSCQPTRPIALSRHRTKRG